MRLSILSILCVICAASAVGFTGCTGQSVLSSAVTSAVQAQTSEQQTVSADENTEETADETSSYIERNSDNVNETNFYINANGIVFSAVFADNSSAEALKELLLNGDITINMHDYGGFEKVGPLGTELPRNDEQITTEAGDIILYQGNQITIYYDVNFWSFTRVGKIENITKDELLSAFGDGDVAVTLSLNN